MKHHGSVDRKRQGTTLAHERRAAARSGARAAALVGCGLLLLSHAGGCAEHADFQGDEARADEASAHALDRSDVRVDGVQYTYEQFAEQFGAEDLHWVLTQEVLDEGVAAAFTSPEKRNAAMGIEEIRVSAETPALYAAPFATLYQHKNRGGSAVNITGPAYNLSDQGFNDLATSVDTYSREIILYEHAGHLGCSLFVQRQKYISNLQNHDFCGAFTGNWNDKTSSVSVAN